MTHAEVVIARRAVEEGRGLVVIVNKMDLLRGRRNSETYEDVIKAVPEEIQTVIPQVCYLINKFGILILVYLDLLILLQSIFIFTHFPFNLDALGIAVSFD